MRQRRLLLGLGWLLLLSLGVIGYALWPRGEWNADQIAALRGLWLGSLPPLPPDPSNAVADDPRATALNASKSRLRHRPHPPTPSPRPGEGEQAPLSPRWERDPSQWGREPHRAIPKSRTSQILCPKGTRGLA